MTDGKPVGISFRYQNGMMYGTDYYFIVSEDEIEFAYFFEYDEEGEFTEEFTEYHVPVTSAQWERITEMTMDLLTFVKPLKETKVTSGYTALDAGSESFSLQWLDEEGNTVSISYSFPWEERFESLKEYLKEIVHPINREINYADEPVLNGIIVGSKGGILGLQSYEYTIRTSDGGYTWKLTDSKDNVTVIAKEDWETFAAYVDAYELQYLPYSDSTKKYVTLIYGNGYMKNVVPSDAVLGDMKQYIEETFVS